MVKALFCACDRVPGPTAAGMRVAQLMVTLGDHLEVDGLSVKGADMAHIQRLGAGRMMRVPAPDFPYLDRISAFQRAVHRQLEGETYDLVHAMDVWSAVVAIQHRGGVPFPLITDLDELPSETLPERMRGAPVDEKTRQAVRKAELSVLHDSQAVVVTNAAGARVLVDAGVPENRVHIIPPGVDEAVFAVPGPAPVVPGGDGLTVLYLGAPDASRGLGIFLAAMKILPPDVRGLLCRTRDSEPAAEEAVTAMGLCGRVSWVDVGTPAEMAAALHRVHAAVLLPTTAPDTVHGARIPRRALEALLAGRPLVVAECDGLSHVVQDHDSALVIPQRSARALAQALVELAENPTLLTHLSARGPEVAQPFTWKRRQAQYAKLYDGLLGTSLHAALLSGRPTRLSGSGPGKALPSSRPPADFPTADESTPLTPAVVRVPVTRVPTEPVPDVARQLDPFGGDGDVFRTSSTSHELVVPPPVDLDGTDSPTQPANGGLQEDTTGSGYEDPWGEHTLALPAPVLPEDVEPSTDEVALNVARGEATELIPLPDLQRRAREQPARKPVRARPTSHRQAAPPPGSLEDRDLDTEDTPIRPVSVRRVEPTELIDLRHRRPAHRAEPAPPSTSPRRRGADGAAVRNPPGGAARPGTDEEDDPEGTLPPFKRP